MTETKSDVGWRITLGLLAAAARLTPVPFLDDVLRTRAFHLLVSRTLRAHGRTYGSVVVAPLYSDSEGCLSGCFTSLLFLPIKLLLFPIRKIFNWVMLAKHLARDLSEALLLGRALDRYLARGGLAPADAPVLRAEAARVRQAFENAMAGTDLGALRAMLTPALRGAGGAWRAALHAIRNLRGQNVDTVDDPSAGLSQAERQAVRAETDRVAKVLDTPEMRTVLERFDARFEESLRVLEARART